MKATFNHINKPSENVNAPKLAKRTPSSNPSKASSNPKPSKAKKGLKSSKSTYEMPTSAFLYKTVSINLQESEQQSPAKRKQEKVAFGSTFDR